MEEAGAESSLKLNALLLTVKYSMAVSVSTVVLWHVLWYHVIWFETKSFSIHASRETR